MSRIPIWGTFVILLIFLLSAVGFVGWSVYDSKVRQPKIAARREAMRDLYKRWDLAVARIEYSEVQLASERQRIKNGGLAKGEVEDEWEKDAQRQSERLAKCRQEEALWLQRLEENRKMVVDLDRESRDRFGVPAEKLPTLFEP